MRVVRSAGVASPLRRGLSRRPLFRGESLLLTLEELAEDPHNSVSPVRARTNLVGTATRARRFVERAYREPIVPLKGVIVSH